MLDNLHSFLVLMHPHTFKYLGCVVHARRNMLNVHSNAALLRKQKAAADQVAQLLNVAHSPTEYEINISMSVQTGKRMLPTSGEPDRVVTQMRLPVTQPMLEESLQEVTRYWVCRSRRFAA